MSCNMRDCQIPGDHVHLPREAELAIARVLLEDWWRRKARQRRKERGR